MAEQRDPMAGEQAAAERAPEQQGDSSWPKPGEEGFVHPDGTPQAERQLAENRQAAQDRAAAGSTVHGAPVARNDVQDPGVSAAVAEKRAEEYSGPSEAKRQESTTQFVTEGMEEMADRQQAAQERAAAEQRDAAGPKPAATSDSKTTKSAPSGAEQQKR
jgi:hypothetical protein